MNFRLALASGLLLAWAATAQAKPAVPDLARTLYDCQKQHGSAPKLPVASSAPAGLSPKGSGLTPAEAPGAITVNPRTASCVLDAMGSEVVVYAPIGLHVGIEDAFSHTDLGMALSAERLAYERKYFEGVTAGRKDRPILVYCHHTSCFLSYNAVLQLRDMGYTNLLWMREGQEGWVAAGLPLGPSLDLGKVWLPDVKAPQRPHRAHRDYAFPRPYGADKARPEDTLKALGVDMAAVCASLGQGRDARTQLFFYEAELYRAAGVDLERDNAAQVRRKMQQLFKTHGESVRCFGERLLQFAAGVRHTSLLAQAARQWRLPAQVLNAEGQYGATLLDEVENELNNPQLEGEDRDDMALAYRLLRRYNAKTRAELVAAGTLADPRALQKAYLADYARAADGGDHRAMLHLARVHLTGAYVSADRAEADRWTQRAERRIVEAKDYDAMIDRARSYAMGQLDAAGNVIVPPDSAASAEWVRRAEPGNTKDTNFWYGRALLEGAFGAKDARGALKYLERAYAQGASNESALALAYIETGDKAKAAPYLRALPLEVPLAGLPVRDWFARLDIAWCGPKAGSAKAVACDGSNAAPPAKKPRP
jgi:rhodanese-related sulfurtransferase